jgi:hypothetical protein
MKPSQRVAEICAALGLGCRPAASVPEADWAKWLDGFEMPTVRECPECGAALVERSGKFGPFWGCSNYPQCKHTEGGGND